MQLLEKMSMTDSCLRQRIIFESLCCSPKTSRQGSAYPDKNFSTIAQSVSKSLLKHTVALGIQLLIQVHYQRWSQYHDRHRETCCEMAKGSDGCNQRRREGVGVCLLLAGVRLCVCNKVIPQPFLRIKMR